MNGAGRTIWRTNVDGVTSIGLPSSRLKAQSAQRDGGEGDGEPVIAGGDTPSGRIDSGPFDLALSAHMATHALKHRLKRTLAR